MNFKDASANNGDDEEPQCNAASDAVPRPCHEPN